jgi:tetratricopeptide (TPR) repeat protein/predicted Ser/Thr protein kinase
MGNHPEKVESANKTYKIIKPLGEGGTSVVYLAADGNKKVALKILGEQVDPAFKEKYVQILKNEFEVLSRLHHPNIAEVYDFDFASELGKYFFTTEFIDGTDLYNYTQTSDFRTKEELFVQLLAALEYVHRSGVIHCDIKCGNALVTQIKKTPVVKLVDFGFATRQLAESNFVVGTAHYLAPELLVSERKDVDHRVDIYAAGIVFYRLLHRAYPYDASTVANILKWHREGGTMGFADEIPDYVRHLILRMTATYPTDRIVSCAKAIEFINLRTENRYKRFAEKVAGLQYREGPLVGRTQMVKKSEDLLATVKALKPPPSGGFIITGQQGIGKSRILKEIKYRAELEEVPIREFICVESKDLVEDFAGRFREIEGMSFGQTQTEDKRKLLEVQWINTLLEKYKEKPLVIMIDDVQLADSAFIKFLSLLEDRLRVNRSERAVPIALLFGVRPRNEQSDLVGRWFDKSTLEKLELAPLSKEDIEAYVANIGVADSKKVIEQAASFSGGVPGLVEAYCQHILSPVGAAKLPESLAQSYLDRAKYLSKQALNCLEFICVARRNLSIENLAALTSLGKDKVIESLPELSKIGFANVSYPSTEIALTNKAIAQAIKSGLKEPRLKEISTALGAWLEKADPSALPEIAEYFAESGVNDRAQCYAESAAKFFEERFNNSEASKFYELALTHVVEGDKKKRDLIRATARTGVMMGKFKDSIARLEDLIKGGDATLENYRILGMAHSKMHDFDHARQWYEAGLAKMSDETAITDIVQFKNSLGNVFFYMGNLEKSEKYFTEAVADATVCLLLNNNLGLILSAKGNYDQAVKFYDSRKKFLAAKQNKRALSLCYSESGYVHMTNNRFEEAVKDLEESYKLALEIGDWYNILVILGNLVRCHQQLAQYSKALDCALKGLEVEGSVGSIEEIAQNHLTIGILYESIGVLDLAQQHIGMALDRFTALGNKLMLGWCHLSMAYLKKDMDKPDEATSALDAADQSAAELKNDDLSAWAKYTRAELMAEYGKKQEASVILNKIKPLASTEFEVRRKLLALKLGLFPESETKKEFESLSELSKGFPELEWETYSTYGTFLESSNKTQEAEVAFRHAYEIIQGIAVNLGDAYRDSYKSQRFRMKVVQRFEPDFYAKAKKAPKEPVKKEVAEGKTTEIK